MSEKKRCRSCYEDYDEAEVRRQFSEGVADGGYCSAGCFTNDAVKEAFAGYTRRQLHDAFEKVQDESNWKNAFEAEVEESKVGITVASIAFFLADEPTVVPSLESGKMRIKTKGYQA